MKNNEEYIQIDKNLKSALALVEVASLKREGDSNIRLHPSLKRKIALEISKRPELTAQLFKADFLTKLKQMLISGHTTLS